MEELNSTGEATDKRYPGIFIVQNDDSNRDECQQRGRSITRRRARTHPLVLMSNPPISSGNGQGQQNQSFSKSRKSSKMTATATVPSHIVSSQRTSKNLFCRSGQYSRSKSKPPAGIRICPEFGLKKSKSNCDLCSKAQFSENPPGDDMRHPNFPEQTFDILRQNSQHNPNCQGCRNYQQLMVQALEMISTRDTSLGNQRKELDFFATCNTELKNLLQEVQNRAKYLLKDVQNLCARCEISLKTIVEDNQHVIPEPNEHFLISDLEKVHGDADTRNWTKSSGNEPGEESHSRVKATKKIVSRDSMHDYLREKRTRKSGKKEKSKVNSDPAASEDSSEDDDQNSREIQQHTNANIRMALFQLPTEDEFHFEPELKTNVEIRQEVVSLRMALAARQSLLNELQIRIKRANRILKHRCATLNFGPDLAISTTQFQEILGTHRKFVRWLNRYTMKGIEDIAKFEELKICPRSENCGMNYYIETNVVVDGVDMSGVFIPIPLNGRPDVMDPPSELMTPTHVIRKTETKILKSHEVDRISNRKSEKITSVPAPVVKEKMEVPEASTTKQAMKSDSCQVSKLRNQTNIHVKPIETTNQVSINQPRSEISEIMLPVQKNIDNNGLQTIRNGNAVPEIEIDDNVLYNKSEKSTSGNTALGSENKRNSLLSSGMDSADSHICKTVNNLESQCKASHLQHVRPTPKPRRFIVCADDAETGKIRDLLNAKTIPDFNTRENALSEVQRKPCCNAEILPDVKIPTRENETSQFRVQPDLSPSPCPSPFCSPRSPKICAANFSTFNECPENPVTEELFRRISKNGGYLSTTSVYSQSADQELDAALKLNIFHMSQKDGRKTKQPSLARLSVTEEELRERMVNFKNSMKQFKNEVFKTVEYASSEYTNESDDEGYGYGYDGEQSRTSRPPPPPYLNIPNNGNANPFLSTVPPVPSNSNLNSSGSGSRHNRRNETSEEPNLSLPKFQGEGIQNLNRASELNEIVASFDNILSPFMESVQNKSCGLPDDLLNTEVEDLRKQLSGTTIGSHENAPESYPDNIAIEINQSECEGRRRVHRQSKIPAPNYKYVSPRARAGQGQDVAKCHETICPKSIPIPKCSPRPHVQQFSTSTKLNDIVSHGNKKLGEDRQRNDHVNHKLKTHGIPVTARCKASFDGVGTLQTKPRSISASPRVNPNPLNPNPFLKGSQYTTEYGAAYNRFGWKKKE